MNLTIFGVGRSGTKAVQLYMSYLLAQKEGNVWINYEPYFWINRFTQSINYEGYYHHTHSPHLCSSPKEFSKEHQQFIKWLAQHDMSTVTKFIRGNGRIDAINQLIQPDHSIVIIRDIYQVLTSVIKTEWDFWSVGFEFSQNWDNFVAEVRKRKLLDNLDWCIDQITDRMDKNAFYWYVMNKAVLYAGSSNTYFIHYKNIRFTEDIAREIIDPEIRLSIKDDIFTGDNIHENYPLKSENISYGVNQVINAVFYKSKLMNNYGLYLSNRKYGNSSYINHDYKKVQSRSTDQTSVRIEKKELYEFFNEDIGNLLRKIEWKPVNAML